MSRLRLSTMGLAATAAVSTAVLLQPGLGAQSDPPRPSISLTKLPTLERNVQVGDFNHDGIPDLIAGRSTGEVVVVFGRGDGTFSEAELIATQSFNPVVGDVNGDGHLDIIVNAAVIPGNGDGTFDEPVPSTVVMGDASSRVADFNGDGHLDVVVGTPVFQTVTPGSSPRLYLGNGDFSFRPPTLPVLVPQPTVAAIGDFTADGLPEIVLIPRTGQTVVVLLNRHPASFGLSAITFDHRPTAATAADMNADGILDLIVTTAHSGSFDPRGFASTGERGSVHVLPGNGDGSFQPAISVQVDFWASGVAVGDVNGDGIVDVATHNEPLSVECGPDFLVPTPRSVSILPGIGGGQLGPPASFSLGDFSNSQGGIPHHLVTASDLNGDGRTDLVASSEAIVLSLPPEPNRAPSVSAPPGRTFFLATSTDFPGEAAWIGEASDPDHDRLTYLWTDQAGRIVGRTPFACVNDYGGTHTFTLTVSDGRGGVASDSVTHVFELSEFDALAPGWTGQDIGGVGLSGRTVFDGRSFTLTGSGADIWGTSDEFHFTSVVAQGDLEITARVTSVENLHPWTKAGVMIREGAGASDRHAFLFVTPTAVNGVAFQRRVTAGGITVHTAGPPAGAPAWLRLRREGDVITAFVRDSESATWTTIGTQTLGGLAASVRVGLAVTSHVDGSEALATFDEVTVTGLATGLPDGWKSADIGATTLPGSTAWSGTAFTVTASGADIWGTTDAFHFAYRELSENATVVVRVADLAGPHPWSKAGLMIRSSLDPSSPHAFLLASEANGLAFQNRDTFGGLTRHTELVAPALPGWFALQRESTSILAWYSPDGRSWRQVSSSRISPGTALIGVAVTSHDPSQVATAVFDSLVISTDDRLSSGLDIGDVGIAGTTVFQGGRYTISSSGADVWGSADAFRYSLTSLAGDGGIVARVASLSAPHPWAKAGVMIRLPFSPSAPHGFVFVSRDNGLAFQRRTTTGGLTSHTGGGAGTAPQWVMLVRTGITLTASVSSDGITWTELGSDTFPEMANQPLWIGLAVTSHDNSALATATFDHVVVDRGGP